MSTDISDISDISEISERTLTEVTTEILLCTQYGWKQHYQFREDIECKICMEDLYGKYVLETNCGHYMDLNCAFITLIDYKYTNCPYCNNKY